MILILGGTKEARELAARLYQAGLEVTTSLAGRVQNPRLPVGDVRIGGFGGPERLAGWLRHHRVRAVIDATHPFALRISDAAVAACAATKIPLLRLERPGWDEQPGDRWTWAEDVEHAAALIPALGKRVFLTTGRQGLPAFAGSRAWFLIRTVDPPAPPLPRNHQLILARGPYTVEGELALIDRYELDLLITKDSGGELTEAKLEAARVRQLPVIVVRRPPHHAPGGTVSDVETAAEWARQATRPHGS